MLIMDSMFVLDQDSVRLLAVEGCAALGKLLEPQDCVAHILPVIVNFSQVHFWTCTSTYKFLSSSSISCPTFALL